MGYRGMTIRYAPPEECLRPLVYYREMYMRIVDAKCASKNVKVANEVGHAFGYRIKTKLHCNKTNASVTYPGC